MKQNEEISILVLDERKVINIRIGKEIKTYIVTDKIEEELDKYEYYFTGS